jgi:hypothetical protein
MTAIQVNFQSPIVQHIGYKINKMDALPLCGYDHGSLNACSMRPKCDHLLPPAFPTTSITHC